MVKGHERKSYQPSSSAKAAQLLASSAPKAGGFGFGGCEPLNVCNCCLSEMTIYATLTARVTVHHLHAAHAGSQELHL